MSSIDRRQPIPKFIRELKGISENIQGSLCPIGNVFEILSTSSFAGGAALTLRYDTADMEPLRFESVFDERKISIYQLTDGEWLFVGGFAQDGTVSANINQAGIYAMFYDPNLEPSPAVIIPKALEFPPNYPNPFNPTTTIRFGIPQEGMVRLSIYNIRGQLVKVLIDGVRSAGYDFVTWDGSNAQAQPVGTGVYFTRLESNGVVKTNKILLLK
jgi:hypothetical protein